MSDLISRADAIEAVMAEGRNVHTSEYANAERIIHEADAVEALSMLPSAKALTSQDLAEPNNDLRGSDLIRRSDAIEAVIGACQYVCDCYDNVVTTINALPSAGATQNILIHKAVAKAFEEGREKASDSYEDIQLHEQINALQTELKKSRKMYEELYEENEYIKDNMRRWIADMKGKING